ncbi:glycosyltransferase [Dinghuibacter silviterrae]|uniref:Glycosyl transferase family 1 n=1 Tax=Dinghuibacter silviterrae TaxID=1539049 RepID=A0A4R8DUN6_9BACT|nr:glycosyltransferase [Dinghuibacter silviterrae]TDX01656.1 glycosyl transferase family 1 [Dinghuibacter silviterrae]
MHLHLLSFTIPYPADFGGAIDVLEKIKALHAEGVRVHLHCFRYNRPEAPELEQYCAEVRYYKRQTRFSLTLPYIVSSRVSMDLMGVLDADDYPILAEGVHTAYALLQGRWPGRVMALRLHNVETNYYANLAALEKAAFKRSYYRLESWLLGNWERKVSGLPLLAIHPGVGTYFQQHYRSGQVTYLPAFTSYAPGNNPTGRGEYVLFHGDFSVVDNVESLRWLLEEVGRGSDLPWVVAGRRGQNVEQILKAHPYARLVADPGAEEMETLIREAQVHVVHSFNPEGIKIKLLHALFAGRHCIAQEALLEGTGLEETCRPAANAMAFKTQLDMLWALPFTEEEKKKRTEVLRAQFDNRANARKLMALMGL